MDIQRRLHSGDLDTRKSGLEAGGRGWWYAGRGREIAIEVEFGMRELRRVGAG